MNLSHDIISQFAKVVNKDKKQKTESTVYGVIKIDSAGNKYVQLDGSDQLTPLTDTDLAVDFMSATANKDDRVSVLIKDHTATVTGNLSSPAVGSGDVDERIETFNQIVVDQVNANAAYIEKLQTDKADVGDLEAAEAKITELETTKASIEDLEAVTGNIENLNTTFANIDFSNISKAAMEYFYSNSGLIENVVVGDQTITGNLVGVTISGDLIEGNTIKAEKLVIKGDDGLYYKLNTDGVKIEAQQTDYNSINGQVIKAKSITATKISVSDLVAFDATIGGFNITDNSLYSGVKGSVDNTTRGIYLDNDGQMVIGDANHYLKYYKDSDDSYKLELSIDSLSISGQTVSDMIDGVQVGGRNLLQKSNPNKWLSEWLTWRASTSELLDDSWLKVTVHDGQTSYGYYPPKISTFSEIGEYTLSFEAYSDDSTALNYNYIMSGEGNNRLPDISITTTPTKYVIQVSTTKSYTNASILLGSASGTSFYIRNIKFELGNKATDYTEAPEDIDVEIEDASKTASNFLFYDAVDGLMVGNNIGGSWKGIRTQITNAAFRILNSAGTVLASYGEKLIELGRNATDAIIKFCGGKGQIEYDANDDCLQLSADNVRLKGTEMASLYSNYADSNGIFRNGAVHASPGNVRLTAGGGSDNSNVQVNPTNIHMSTDNYYISGVMNDSDNGGTYVSVTEGNSGIWTYRKYSNGDVELWGTYYITDMDCIHALGSLYRTLVFEPDGFPFAVYSPHLTASYETEGYGAILWATTNTTSYYPPHYYLLRPISGTITYGQINFHVHGKWKY